MATTFHLEDKVTYLFGDGPEYRVVATKEQPRVRNSGLRQVELPEGSDYLIIRVPLSEGIINPYISVREAHIELVR